jgi:hypothetical protein
VILIGSLADQKFVVAGATNDPNATIDDFDVESANFDIALTAIQP